MHIRTQLSTPHGSFAWNRITWFPVVWREKWTIYICCNILDPPKYVATYFNSIIRANHRGRKDNFPRGSTLTLRDSTCVTMVNTRFLNLRCYAYILGSSILGHAWYHRYDQVLLEYFDGIVLYSMRDTMWYSLPKCGFTQRVALGCSYIFATVALVDQRNPNLHHAAEWFPASSSRITDGPNRYEAEVTKQIDRCTESFKSIDLLQLREKKRAQLSSK